MHLNTYQKEAIKTAIYPDASRIVYPTLGLVGEAGEVAEKVKKIIRSGQDLRRLTPHQRTEIIKELGDVLWYAANLATDLGTTLDVVANTNLQKLADRADRGVLQGNGDNR